MEEKTDMVSLHILQAKFSKETLKKISLRGQEKFTLMISSFNKASGWMGKRFKTKRTIEAYIYFSFFLLKLLIFSKRYV